MEIPMDKILIKELKSHEQTALQTYGTRNILRHDKMSIAIGLALLPVITTPDSDVLINEKDVTLDNFAKEILDCFNSEYILNPKMITYYYKKFYALRANACIKPKVLGLLVNDLGVTDTILSNKRNVDEDTLKVLSSSDEVSDLEFGRMYDIVRRLYDVHSTPEQDEGNLNFNNPFVQG